MLKCKNISVARKAYLCAVVLALTASAFAADPISIKLAHNAGRERQTSEQLQKVISSYDLSKYTFTREVVIEERAMNHAFPVLTLNVRFADSPDELLSSYVHEQLHWYLRDHDAQQKAAIDELRQMYPNAPVGLPEGADSAYSTYGHLVDCYLEIQADRELIGPKRTDEVIRNKPWYTWIYKTILRDEDKIRGVVQEHNLELTTETADDMIANPEPIGFGPSTNVSCGSIRLVPLEMNAGVSKLTVRLETIKTRFKRHHESVVEITTVLVRKLQTDGAGRIELDHIKPGRYVLRAEVGGHEAVGTIDVPISQSSECTTDLQIWDTKDFVAIGRRPN